MKIRTQFFITMLLFGVVLIIVSASAVITNQQVKKTGAQEEIANTIARGADELSYMANDYLIYRESQQLSRWQSRFDSFSGQVASLQVSRLEQQELVRHIQASQLRLKDVFDSAVSGIGSLSENQNATIDLAFIQVSWSRISVQSQGLVSDASLLAQLLHAQSDGYKLANMVFLFAMIGVTGAYFVISYFLVQRRLLKSIAVLQTGAAIIGSGNLDFKIEHRKNDEIGDLSRAFDRMTDGLKTVTASKTELEKEVEERKRAEEAVRLNEVRLESLLRIAEYKAESVREFLDYSLDETLKLTGSKIGYIYLYDEDKREFTLNTWSKDVMKECTVADRQTLYQLEKTGIWGEVVQQRKPIIINDYQAPNELKKGYPEGHSPLYRWMSIPVFSEEKIVAVVGIANKATDYDQTDIRQLTLLMSSVWTYVERQKVEARIRHQSAMQIAVNRILQEAITCETVEALGSACLAVAEELTGSKFGFLDEVNPDGLLDKVAISNAGWDACRMAEKTGCGESPRGLKIHGIYGRVIRDGKGFYTNDPSSHPDSVGVPEGHPALTAFLGVPLIRDNTTIGMMALGNREGGYRAEDLEAAEALAPAIVEAMMRKRAESALKESERRLRESQELLEAVTRGTNVIMAVQDTDFRYLYFNTAYREEIKRLSGKDIEVGMSMVDVFAHLPEQRDIAVREWSQALNGESTNRTLEFGEPGGYRRIYSVLHTPVRDAAGKVVAVGEIAYDITEQVRAQDALRESEERFRTVFERAEIGIVVADTDGRVIEVNPALARILGYTRQDLLNRSFTEFTHPDDIDAEWSLIREVLAGKRNYFEIEKRYVRKDSQTITVRVVASLVRNKLGEPLVGIALVDDITERKRLETMKDEFIGMVSHEIKTPLTVVIGTLATAVSPGISQKEYVELLQDAINSAEYLNDIVDNLLELSRSQANRLVLQKEPVPVEEVVSSVLQKLHGKSTAHRLEVDIPPGLPPAPADRLRMERILYNLVDNAVKYSPGGDFVKIAVRRGDNELVVSVTDRGIGISPDGQARLFQSFERLASENSSYIHGIGLGLRVCRILVEAHGGRIWVESEPAKGSTFLFTLPTGGTETA